MSFCLSMAWYGALIMALVRSNTRWYEYRALIIRLLDDYAQSALMPPVPLLENLT